MKYNVWRCSFLESISVFVPRNILVLAVEDQIIFGIKNNIAVLKHASDEFDYIAW